jgi:hypothetical protein
MTNQQIKTHTLFYKTITFTYPCTVTLEQYLQLCEQCPQGCEQSLKVTDEPSHFDLSNTAVVDAVLSSRPVIEPVLLFNAETRPCSTCDADGICTAMCISQPCKPEGATTCLPKKSITTECLAHSRLSLSTRIQSLNSITTQTSSRTAS